MAPESGPAWSSFFLRQKTRVHRDQGSRQNSFAKQILEKVRDLERGVERVCSVALAKVVVEGPLPHQSHQAAE